MDQFVSPQAKQLFARLSYRIIDEAVTDSASIHLPSMDDGSRLKDEVYLDSVQQNQLSPVD